MIFAVAAALALYVALRMARAAQVEWRDFHPRRGMIARPDDAPADLTEVAFQSLNGSLLRGFWLPSRNGVAVVFVHGSSGDRRGLYPQALFLHEHGFGALLFDMPGHGESEGSVHWSDEARAAVRGALRFAREQSGVSSAGAYGFSMGAYTVAQIATDEPAFVVLDGVPSDGEALTKWQHRRLGPLTGMAGVWTDRFCGFRPDPLPLDTIARYSGRLLFIIGEQDAVVPPSMQEAVAHAAPGTPRICRAQSGHGDWMEKGGTCRAALLELLEAQVAPARRAEAR
jgi:pimeloyl-ACP methyl ester carboxylesterase